MRCGLLALVAALGCAHAAPPAPPAVSPSRAPNPIPARPAAARPAEDEGVRLEGMLAGSGLSYVTVEPGRMWMIGFARDGRSPVVVHVVRGDAYTMIMGRLGTVPPRAGAEFYRLLARQNFDVPQLKLGLDAHDGLYASFEVPSRLVDRDELLEDVFTLARTLDEVRARLFEGEEPEKSPAPPATPLVPLPPADAGPIIEARR